VSEKLECLDQRQGGCSGPIEMRYPLSSTGRSFARCERHWEERLKEQERINHYYPDSATPPDWFDPENAGESWGDDY
jgi:hypothetical protein